MGLVAIALISVTIPALACVMLGKSGPDGHSCCERVTNIQGGGPVPSGNSCCVIVANESPSAPVAAFKCSPPAVVAVSYSDVPAVADAQPLSSGPVEEALSPLCNTSSVLRV